MKFLHLADIQLGAQFKILGERAQDQREQVKKTFHNALELGVKEEVSLVVVAGDLFDSNHPSRELVEFVRGEFGFLQERNIQVSIVPGHHDCLDEHGIYNRERFDEEFLNVFIFRNPEGEAKEYTAVDIAVLAKPNVASTSVTTPLPNVESLTSNMRYKILAAHGDVQIPGKSAENYHPIALAELEALEDIDYVALGHWHSMKDCTQFGNFKMPVWYSGSPELVALDQAGSGNVLVVDIGDGGAKVTPVKVGKRGSTRVALDISTLETLEDLKKRILEHAGEDTILQVELSGLNTNNVMMDVDRLEEELQDSFFFIRVSDKSTIVLTDIPEYPDQLIQGQFLKIMRKRIKEATEKEKKIYEEALQMGLAELEGKEVI